MALVLANYPSRDGRLANGVGLDTPASAALCGYRPVPVSSSEKGILAADDIAALMDEDTAGIMVTNPNTLGLFEEEIADTCVIG